MKSKKNIVIALICICLAGLMLFHIIPSNEGKTGEMPAIMVNLHTGEIQETTLNLEGKWSTPKIGKAYYSGKIEADALAYTCYEDNFEQKSEVIDDGTWEYVGFFYNNSNPEINKGNGINIGFGWLYTTKERDAFIFHTGENKEDLIYAVIAPAETEEEAKKISNKVGLTYPG